MVSFPAAVKAGIAGLAVWNARSTRAEFWWWTLFSGLIGAIAMFVDMSMGSYLFTAIVYLVLFLPSLAVLVRRLHDLDKSGWFYWVVLIPFVGGLILLVFMLMPSAPSSRWERSLVAPEAAE